VREFTAQRYQHTDERGPATSRVHHGPVELVMDVPRDTFLPAWAYAPDRHHEANLLCRDVVGGGVAQTLHLPQAYCVGYDEHFVAGDTGRGAFQCHVTLVAPDGWAVIPGAPGKYVPPAPREHGIPPVAALAAVAPPAPLSKQQRYDARRKLLAQSRAQLAADSLGTNPLAAPADATRVAPSPAAARLGQQRAGAQQAAARLARNNVAVERARLSEHVYASDKIPPVPAPEGWHQLTARELAGKGVTPDLLNDPKSGFKAALYQSSFERPPKLVVAYAGTEDGPDWTTNLQQGIGVETKQYNAAMNLADKVVKTTDISKVDITGHSLGGGLASAASVVTGAKGYTFNAAGLHPKTVARAPYNVSAANMQARGKGIDAYHSAADPLTNLQSGVALAQGPCTRTRSGRRRWACRTS
jgi:type VI secretion system secreted protein VgrG